MQLDYIIRKDRDYGIEFSLGELYNYNIKIVKKLLDSNEISHEERKETNETKKTNETNESTPLVPKKCDSKLEKLHIAYKKFPDFKHYIELLTDIDIATNFKLTDNNRKKDFQLRPGSITPYFRNKKYKLLHITYYLPTTTDFLGRKIRIKKEDFDSLLDIWEKTDIN